MISDYFTLALRNLKKRRLRSGLTVLGIIIAIATLFVLVSVSVGLREAISEQFRILGTDKFFIQPLGQAGTPGSSPVMLTIEDVHAIEKVAGVKEVSYGTVSSAEVEVGDQRRYFMVIGIPLDRIQLFEEIGSYKEDEGRFIEKGDEGEVVLGSQFKYNNLYEKPLHARDKIVINGETFRVRGILAPLGNPQDDRNIYMALEDFEPLFNTGERIDQIFVQVEPGSDVDEVADRVDRRLLSVRDVTEKNRDFTILTPEELIGSFSLILNIITGFLISVAAISLIVGGIGIMNTMFTSVIERTREIGVMKAVGAQNKDVLLIFLVESGLLGIVGGIVGVLLGYGASKTIEYIAVQQLGTNLLRAAAPLYLIVGCLLFAFLAGAISGLWPAWRASKINTVEALRYE